MKVMNWELVEESVPFEKLPAGGYVMTITDVEDVPSREYLWVVYDVKEGPHAGHYRNDAAKDRQWSHRFTRSYKDSAKGMFKAFINRVQESNRGFVWDGRDERQFVGKEVGLLLQTEKYTNDKGEDKERLVVVGVCASQDIRNGDFRLPEPKDRRTSAPAAEPAPTAGPYEESVPF